MTVEEIKKSGLRGRGGVLAGQNLPLFTSCCFGRVDYCEKIFSLTIMLCTAKDCETHRDEQMFSSGAAFKQSETGRLFRVPTFPV